MNQAGDPVTVALTGHLPFVLLLAAILTWPVALGLLQLHSGAVRRSMRSHAPGGGRPATRTAEASGEVTAESAAGPQSSATLHPLTLPPMRPEGAALAVHLIARPRSAALVYTVAGFAYALVMAASQLAAGGMAFRPLRFLTLSWVFAWPVVLTPAIVWASTRRAKVALVAVYILGLMTLGGMAMLSSANLTWGQVFLLWAIYDLPPTVLLLTCLARRVRAVGPLVLTFMFTALVGSDAIVAVAGTRESYLRMIVRVAGSVGLGGLGAHIGLLVIGFVLFAAVGLMALIFVKRRYARKQISDESVTIDAIWLLFAVVHSIDLVFGHPLWISAGVAALAAFKVATRVGFSWLGAGRPAQEKSPALLLLRSFSIGRDSERLFDAVARHWRRVGSMQMIAGIDLAWKTVEPHEFLDFTSGKLSRRFIDGPSALEQRMRERDTRPDRDLRFRINDFFCYDDTWRMVLSRLVHESDAVLMDLRGFTRQNAGCIFEIHELARAVPLSRVVFIVDERTDERLLADTLGHGRASVFRVRVIDGDQIRSLLHALAAAATPAPALGV
jgi:hypothetical protein